MAASVPAPTAAVALLLLVVVQLLSLLPSTHAFPRRLGTAAVVRRHAGRTATAAAPDDFAGGGGGGERRFSSGGGRPEGGGGGRSSSSGGPPREWSRSVRDGGTGGSGGGGGGGNDREWKSGEIFKQNNQQRNRRRNDPWWMRDEEKTNPRVLPEYRPWWASLDNAVPPPAVTGAMKVAELKAECDKRGLPSKGKKDELVEVLEAARRYDLSDGGFRPPTFVQTNAAHPPCYPEVYEDSSVATELSKKAFATFKAPPGGGGSTGSGGAGY